MSDVTQTAEHLASEFRLGRAVEACLVLPDFLMEVHASGNLEEAKFAAFCGEVLECQQKKDWLGLADFLQYEMID